jgi:hypothetical protein
MASPHPGTLPAYPPYQPGQLPLSGQEQLYLVSTANATAASSWRWPITDIGKVASILPVTNPTPNDLFAFTQMATGLPRSCALGSFAVPAGNVAAGGTFGQVYMKNSSTAYDANFTSVVPTLTLSTATVGSLAVQTVATVAALVFTTGTATNLSATNATIGNLSLTNLTTGAATATSLNVGNLTAGTASISTAAIGTGTITNLTVTTGTISALTFIAGTGTNLFVATQTANNLNATTETVSGIFNALATANFGGVINFAQPLTVINGGIGTSILTPNGVLYGGTSAVGVTAAGATGLVLMAQGASNPPIFAAVGMVLLNTLTPNGVASASDTTSFTSTYRTYIITLENICPATNTATFQMRVATTGSNFVTGGYFSSLSGFIGSNGNLESDTSTTAMLLSGSRATTAVATTTNAGVTGLVYFMNPASASILKQFSGNTSYQASNGALSTTSFGNTYFSGTFNSSSPIVGINFAFSSGNIATGTIQIWGLS